MFVIFVVTLVFKHENATDLKYYSVQQYFYVIVFICSPVVSTNCTKSFLKALICFCGIVKSTSPPTAEITRAGLERFHKPSMLSKRF